MCTPCGSGVWARCVHGSNLVHMVLIPPTALYWQRYRVHKCPFREYWPLFKCVGSILCPALYIASFAARMWVRLDSQEYGLWSWCFNNFTDSDVSKGCHNVTRCHDIHPGDSPAYYELARVVACIGLFPFLTFFLTFNPQQGLGKGRHPMAVAISSAAFAVITLTIIGAGYKSDSRWKGFNPRLGLSFWLTTGTSFVCLFMCLVHYKLEQIAKASSASSSAPARSSAATTAPNNPPRPTPTNVGPPNYDSVVSSSGTAMTSTSRMTTASSTSTATTTTATTTTTGARSVSSTSTTPQSGATGGSQTSQTARAAAAKKGDNGRSPETRRSGAWSSGVSPEFPVLVLPVSPPPSYEEGLDNYSECPPAYAP